MPNFLDALEIAAATDVGRMREHNEDAILFDPSLGIVILADGMGGYQAGEIASGLAVDAVNEILRAELDAMQPHLRSGKEVLPLAHQMLSIAMQRANSVVYQHATQHPLCAGMGTTLIASLFYDNRLIVGHAGDSRLYRMRDDVLIQISHDHSLIQEQIDAGLIAQQDAREVSFRHFVTRAVGIDAEVDIDIEEHATQVGDLYLYCSDGLSDMLEDAYIASLMRRMKDNLPALAEALVQKANEMGGRDNISLVLVGIRADYSVSTGWASRLAAKIRA